MSMRLGLGLGLPYLGRVGGAPAEPDFFVDSVGGDDGNDGLTAETAFQTLGAVTWADDLYVVLIAGSQWREELSESNDSLTVKSEGVGDFPLVDGSDVITTWTAHATEADVWEKTVDHAAGSGTNRLRVYEDDIRLTRVADAATCSSTPGSFVDKKGSDGDPWTVQIHASDSGNPNSNGSTYEAPVRLDAVHLGDNAVLEGVQARRALTNNGAIEIGDNASVKRCLSVDGSKHNMLVGSGVVEDTGAVRIDTTTSYELGTSYVVGYRATAPGFSHTFRRCFAFADLGGTRLGNAYLSHDGAAGQFDSFTGQQLWAVDVGTGWHPSAVTNQITGYFTDNANLSFATTSDDFTLQYGQVKHGADPGRIPLTVDGSEAAFAIEDTVFYNTGASNGIIRIGSILDGAVLTLSRNVFYMDGAFGDVMRSEGTAWSDGGLVCNNNIMVYASNGNPITVPTGVTYEGDNNVFVCNTDSKDNLNLTYHGTGYDTLAAWQTATGQDANSIALGPSDVASLFSGTVADGDFTLGGTGAGAQAAAISAGPQNHWDWNARAVASGPPTAWPDVPRTLAEAETYVADPTAWDFYSAAPDGSALVQGDMSVTEGADVAFFSTTLTTQATMDVTEGADTVEATGQILVQGDLAVTEGADIAEFAGEFVPSLVFNDARNSQYLTL